MNNTKELKLCPFCGHTPELIESEMAPGNWRVGCVDSFCTISINLFHDEGAFYSSKHSAIKGWNKRSVVTVRTPEEDELDALNRDREKYMPVGHAYLMLETISKFFEEIDQLDAWTDFINNESNKDIRDIIEEPENGL